MWYWDGNHWTQSGDGGGGVGPGGPCRITISSIAPLFPAPGDVWFDSISTQTFVWYADGTSGQWVVAVNGGGGAGGGTGGGLSDAPATGGPYARQGGNWVVVVQQPIDAGTY